MTYEIVKEFSDRILFETEGPFISLYQTTHRHSPDNKQDPIVFKKLVNSVEEALGRKYPDTDKERIMKPFYELKEDYTFWNSTADGMCILANPNKCFVYIIREPLKELTAVSESFHIKPLIKFFRSGDRFHVLSLDRSKFTLYEGNRHELKEVDLGPDTPRTIEEVLGDDYTQPQLTHGSHGGTDGTAIYHGFEDKSAEVDKDTEKFFTHVDKVITENYSKPLGIPLILFALPEHQGEFKKISRNPYLGEDGIKHSHKAYDIGKIHEKAREIADPLYNDKINRRINSFEKAKADSQGSEDIKRVGKAAFENRVETVLIESDRIIPGKMKRETGEIIEYDEDIKGYDDILDDIAETVIKNGGEVMVLPNEKMPTKTGIAAIFRY